jgi:dynein light chain roadblock-type
MSADVPAPLTVPTPTANGTSPTSGTSDPLSPTSATHAPAPPEIEATLQRLAAYRNVRGVMIIARGQTGNGATGGIIQNTGTVFEGESGRRYAGALEAVVNATAGAVGACNDGVSVGRGRGRGRRGREVVVADDD